MNMRGKHVLLGAMWLVIPATAAAQGLGVAPPIQPTPPAGAASPAAVGETTEYVLGPEDVIEVEIVGQPDRWRARVYTDGTVQLNLVGKLTAQGKTPRQLGDEVGELLRRGGFYANPAVNVEVVSYASRYVTVLGAVVTPSLVPINRPYRLSEILARVGGVQASAADYLIVRPESGAERRYFIQELATGDETKDPFVTPGDKIYSPAAEVFYVSGQVNSPGTFAVKSNLTVRQAIALAGGLTVSGSEKKVQTTRDGKKVKLDPDAKIEPGDVLVIGERLF